MSFNLIRKFNKYYAPFTIRYNSDKILWKAHREINGHKIEFYYRPISLDEFIMKEIFEDNAYKIKKELYLNARVLDLGGHIGLYSLYAHCFTDDITSFEPDERNLKYFNLNLTQNKIIGDISIIPFVIDGTQAREAKLYLYPNTGNNTTIPFPFNGKETKMIPNLDINSYLPCDILKIDIEGAEYDVFKSIQRLDEIHKAITIEVHYHVPDWKNKLNYMVKELISNHFKIEYVNKFSYNGHIYAERTN